MKYAVLCLSFAFGLAEGQVQRRPAPDSATAHLERAAALHKKRDYGNAIPELRRALELRPDLIQAHALLGEELLAQGYAEEALPHLKRGGLAYLHAVALIETNRVPAAVEELVQISTRRPNDPDVLFQLGRASGELMQQAFSRLVRVAPDSARARELEAQSYLGQQRFDLAEPRLRALAQMDPTLAGVHLALGKIAMEKGDYDEAEKEFRAEAQLRPGNAEAAWRFGAALLNKGRSKEALPELQRSDRLKPGMLETLLDLGKAYAAENDLENAKTTFLQMIEIEDRSDIAGSAHFQLAQVFRKLGNSEEADKHLKRFRELSPAGQRPRPQ